jgi:hypothetical protein
MTDPVEDTRPGVSLETERPERVIVQPSQDSKLEALHSLYNTLKQEETEAKRKFRELKSAITAELEALYPGDERPSHAYVVPASMYGPELTVYYKSQDYMPDSVIREHFPDIWEAFKKEKHFSEVREKPAGRPRGRK